MPDYSWMDKYHNSYQLASEQLGATNALRAISGLCNNLPGPFIGVVDAKVSFGWNMERTEGVDVTAIIEVQLKTNFFNRPTYSEPVSLQLSLEPFCNVYYEASGGYYFSYNTAEEIFRRMVLSHVGLEARAKAA